MAKVGRPQTLTVDQIATIVADLTTYIESTNDPTIVGFVSDYAPIPLKNGKKYYVNKDYISDHNEFSELRKRAIEKQEAYLLKNATVNKANPTMAIFRLKQPQHGFKDKSEVETTHKGEVVFVNDVPRPKDN